MTFDIETSEQMCKKSLFGCALRFKWRLLLWALVFLTIFYSFVVTINGLGRAIDVIDISVGDSIADVEHKMGVPYKILAYSENSPKIELYVGKGTTQLMDVKKEYWYSTKYLGPPLVWIIQFDVNNRVISKRTLE